MLRRFVLAVLSGALLVAAFEPVAAWWVTPPALAGFALSVHGTRARAAWAPALGFAVAFYVPHIAWMRAVDSTAWIGLAGLEAVFIALVGPVVALVSRHRWWPLWSAAAWSTAESVRSTWPWSGMPWGRLGFGVVDTPLAPLLTWLGVTGTGFVVALGSFALAALVLAVPRVVRGTRDGRAGQSARGGRGRAVAVPGGVLAFAVALVALAAVVPVRLTDAGTAEVAAVQGGVPGAGDDILLDFRQVTQNHVDATVDLADRVARGEAAEPDFVLWPENSTAVDPFLDAATNAQIRRAVAAIDVPVVVGAIVDGGPEHVLNQGIVWDPVSGPGERYTKRHPVPYGEYIPGRQALESLGIDIGNFGDLALIPRDMVAGTRRDPVPVAGVEVADAICFDVAYDDGLYDQVTRGAELLAVQTSNATFIDTVQVDQQFAITRARAIETGHWLVVASTNGLSGVIAPDGRVVATAPRRATAVIEQQVGLVRGVTPGVHVGRWAPRGVALLTALGLVVSLLDRRRSRTRAAPAGGTMETTAGPSRGAAGEQQSDAGRAAGGDPARR